MFPAFEAIITNEPGFLNVNIEQHHSFEAGLEKLKDFATETEPGGYKGEVLRGIIESFAEGLCRHLHEEIECLMGMKTEMEGKGNGGDDGEALLRAYKVAEKEAGKQDKVSYHIIPHHTIPYHTTLHHKLITLAFLSFPFPSSHSISSHPSHPPNFLTNNEQPYLLLSFHTP